MTAVEWVLIVLLLTPSGAMTSFEVETRFPARELCEAARVHEWLTWKNSGYVDSLCEPVGAKEDVTEFHV